MDKKIEKDFAEMVTNLLQTEFCKDWSPKLLHGCMGIASEGGELLTRFKDSLEVGGEFLDRTDTLVEVSDLLHYMQMIIGVLDSSLEEVCSIFLPTYFPVDADLGAQFYDETAMISYCKRLHPQLLRGFLGIGSESGELLNRYKKFMFYHGEPFTRREMLVKLSKLLYYILLIVETFESSLEEVICINMAKLGSRYPEGYSHDKAITHLRDKKAERAAVDRVVDTFAAM